MNWKEISSEEDIESIIKTSYHKPQLLFKHSTRCNISSVVKNRLENVTDRETLDFNYLDLIKYRGISNLIADKFSVHHESPQVLLIQNGNCIFDESHYAILPDEIFQALQ
ncbi:MAG: bacillithiol system redox-active protein YtxJ [Sphingobacteriia bacterium]|nr:bacillithiol system redox-active protein YtxJ [Sphingobacteriia bacterium]